MLLVIAIEALVHAPVLPSVDPKVVHDFALPLSEVSTPVAPLVVPVAGDLVVNPLSLVNDPISPEVLADSILAPFTVLACELRRVRPTFLSLAML
jgi:hypothetical protein